jgi:UDP-glucose 4-epimerase
VGSSAWCLRPVPRNNGEGTAIAEDTPKAPLTPYAADKLSSEYYLDFYRREHGLEPVVLRFFNIFGPRQDPSSPYSGVISIFAQRARQNLPISVFGDGEQTRDFVYVGDLISLLAQAVATRQPPLHPINIGLGRSISLNQLIEALGSAAGQALNVTYLAAREGDIRHSRANPQRLLDQAWLPRPTDIQVGLARLLESL